MQYGRPLLLILVLALSPAQLFAQSGAELRSEFTHLRTAADLEARGDAPGAERIVREVLATNPTSLVALLALERVLARQNRLAEVLPVTDGVLARDPGSTVAHQVRIRTLQQLGSTAALERAATEWLAAAPALETPYREIARAWLASHEPARAVTVLERGRAQLGSANALALELGEVHAVAGDPARAAAEWSRAIGPNGQGFAPVQRRLAQLPAGGAAVIEPLARTLAQPPTTVPRRRAAVQLALDGGLGELATRLLPGLLAELPRSEREPFLAEIARRADGAGITPIALWSYRQLLEVAEADTTRLLALRTRVAQLSMAAGDTAGASRMFATLEKSGATGSPERRQALAVRLQLTAAELDGAALEERLAAFRSEYPDAPELPALTAAIGAELLARGDLAAAERVLAGAGGAQAALLRGRIFLRRGELEHARTELLLAAPALSGAEATRTLATLGALARMGPDAGELVARALERTDADVALAVQELVTGSRDLAPRSGAAVLEYAATLADGAGLGEAAELARREIVAAHGRSDAAPAALFWLAERAATRPEARTEARVLLERLIVEHPRSALVPEARRALDRLRAPASDGSDAGPLR